MSLCLFHLNMSLIKSPFMHTRVQSLGLEPLSKCFVAISMGFFASSFITFPKSK